MSDKRRWGWAERIRGGGGFWRRERIALTGGAPDRIVLGSGANLDGRAAARVDGQCAPQRIFRFAELVDFGEEIELPAWRRLAAGRSEHEVFAVELADAGVEFAGRF